MEKVKIPIRPLGPFPTVLAGADVDGKPNYATIGACGVVSLEPVLYISLRSTHYTTTGVKENGYFSINIPSADMVQVTDYCGIVSGKETSKANMFSSFYDELGRAPMISECPINMLCKVIKSMPIFDFEMFFGEIVSAYANQESLTDGRVDPQKINPMIMMGNSYWNLGQAVGELFKEGEAYKKSQEQ
ncbi:flavin reductase family protein [Heliobacillus mobilis]|uniref:Flavin reductase family protein n=1 Tax=Heliobacterium mobile TaxID=28064 RepID=A0A6I3SMB7_HELMO|nr:flavin reductase family protein [Heliobacterium mobile]MTV49875.1 flavin reductase family protein [Heliobacterium mobile]